MKVVKDTGEKAPFGALNSRATKLGHWIAFKPAYCIRSAKVNKLNYNFVNVSTYDVLPATMNMQVCKNVSKVSNHRNTCDVIWQMNRDIEQIHIHRFILDYMVTCHPTFWKNSVKKITCSISYCLILARVINVCFIRHQSGYVTPFWLDHAHFITMIKAIEFAWWSLWSWLRTGKHDQVDMKIIWLHVTLWWWILRLGS